MSRVNQVTTTNAWALDANTIGLALFAHTAFGLYVVLVKYLLRYLPAFASLAVAFGLAVPITFLVARRNLNWGRLWRTDMLLLSGIVIARSVSKLLAVQFTLATYVQLIDLSIPFLAPIAAWILLRERMPSGTLRALAITALGSFLVIAADPFHVRLPNGKSDLIGVALALVSSIMMALGVVLTRYLTNQKVSPTSVFFQQLLAVAGAYAVLSALSGESWQPFSSVALSTWMIYGLFILFAVLGGGLTQVLAISRINASLFSTLLSWRLVIAVGAGWLLLDERLTSAWQVLGVGMVIMSITLYLRHQARQA